VTTSKGRWATIGPFLPTPIRLPRAVRKPFGFRFADVDRTNGHLPPKIEKVVTRVGIINNKRRNAAKRHRFLNANHSLSMSEEGFQ
jgi:hypothetical protein